MKLALLILAVAVALAGCDWSPRCRSCGSSFIEDRYCPSGCTGESWTNAVRFTGNDSLPMVHVCRDCGYLWHSKMKATR